MTTPNDIIQPCLKRELLIIVGAEDYYSNPGNKMMFMAQAVRYVRLFASMFDLTTVIYYKGLVHTASQEVAFTNAVTRYRASAQPATGWSEAVSHINNTSIVIDGNTCQKRVQVLVFFAHGTPSRGIWLSNNESLYFNQPQAAQIDADSFTPQGDVGGRYASRHVTSWACQTGNKGDSTLTAEQNMGQSLAQGVADSWDIPVYASATRTNYSDTWVGGLEGRFHFNRRMVDNAVWEDDGANAGVRSSTSSLQGNMPQGMFVFRPGQSSGYTTTSLV